MRTATNNPFTPGSDFVPAVWAGRTEQLSDWRDVVSPRRRHGLYERGRTILGEAGLGKSALVARITEEARERGDWVTPQLRIPQGTDPMKALAAAVLDIAEKAGLAVSRERVIGDLLSRVRAVAASGISLTLDRAPGPEPHADLTALLVQIGKAAIAQDKLVVIHLDEVQNVQNESIRSQLLIALGDALAATATVTAPGGVEVERTLPVTVYLTGLPDFAEMAAGRRGATFARRFKTTVLTALSDNDLRAALQQFVLEGWPTGDGERVYMKQDAASAIVDLCRGEPYLFQLAGERAWYAGADQLITREQVMQGWRGARDEATNHVARILEQLPEREREFIEAMAALNPEDRTLTRIAAEAGRTATEAGPTSQRLDTVRGIIARGKPYTFKHRAVEAYLTSDWPDID